MCKLHGVRLIKGIKIFESMFHQILPFEGHINEKVS